MSDALPQEKLVSKSQLEAELDAWKNLKINIGVMGDQNELKKFLINKLIGVEQCSSTEFSSNPTDDAVNGSKSAGTPYTHSNNVNLIIWDLKASNQQDLDKVDLSKYDLLILFRAKPQTNDGELIQSMEKRGKSCLVITFDSPNRLDLTRLHLDIMQALFLLTRDHITTYGLSIDSVSKEILDSKTTILRSRIEKIAWISSMFGHLFHLPRFSILCDTAKLASEIWMYRDQLGLSFEKLSRMASTMNEKLSEIISKSRFASILALKDINSLTALLIKTLPVLILSNDAMDVLRILPAAEDVLHSTISFATQKLALINILEEFSKVSADLHSLSEKTKQLTSGSSRSNSVGVMGKNF